MDALVKFSTQQNTTSVFSVSSDDVFSTVTSISPMVNGSRCLSIHDIPLHRPTRLAILYLTITVGIIGAMLVGLWMVCNRKVSPRFNHLSRVNAFILNLTVADILVIVLAVMPQLIWEYVEREWSAGEVMCRLVKFLQSFSMMASNYILVVIAIDRHQAIRAPLKESFPVWKFAGLGWLAAAVCSLPMFGVFRLNISDGKTMCENIFREKPMFHRQIWIAYIFFSVFFIPLVTLVFCYTRVFMKVAQKANANRNTKTLRFKPHSGKVHLQCTHSTSLPKAKIKTLKLTFVIIMLFIICTSPYFVVEMIMSFGDHCLISRKLYAVFGGMAACNSAVNPFIFLGFNVSIAWLKEVKDRLGSGRKKKPRILYSATSSVGSHPSLKTSINGASLHTFVTS